jgi:FixJ family two-component response regulator
MGGSQKVFVVDDEPMVLTALERLLRSAGHDVATFDTPRGFLAFAESAPAGCAIVDMSMPELSGLDLIGALRASGCLLPLIVITGRRDVADSVKAMKAGAVDFLSKPVDPDALLAAVERGLARDAEGRDAARVDHG